MVKQVSFKSKIDGHVLECTIDEAETICVFLANIKYQLIFMEDKMLPANCRNCMHCFLNAYDCSSAKCIGRGDKKEGIWVLHGRGVMSNFQ